MEHFIRIAFWITTLFSCLQAGRIPLAYKDMGITYMQNEVICPSDSTFYAPANVKVECIASTLDCIMNELKGTVTQECSDPNGRIDQAVEFLEQKERHATTNPIKCECEAWPEAPFHEFLTRVEALLQLENSVQGQ